MAIWGPQLVVAQPHGVRGGDLHVPLAPHVNGFLHDGAGVEALHDAIPHGDVTQLHDDAVLLHADDVILQPIDDGGVKVAIVASLLAGSVRAAELFLGDPTRVCVARMLLQSVIVLFVD